MNITSLSAYRLDILLTENIANIIKKDAFVGNAISYIYDTNFDKYNFDYENILEGYQNILFNPNDTNKCEITIYLNKEEYQKLLIIHFAFDAAYYLPAIISTAIDIYLRCE
jgi:hypothetical protein